MNYQQLLDKLQNIENFSFSRFGDGEFNAILGYSQPSNCDGHQYFKDMGMRLYKIIMSNPNYIMGLQSLAKQVRKDDTDFHKLIEGSDWIDSDIIHRASIRNTLAALFDRLKQRNVILVANVDLLEVSFNFSNNLTSFDHIVISPKDCWLEYKDILKRLKEIATKDVVILYCASMPSEILIDDMYNHFKDNITQIDIGSAFDPYCGIHSRTYHKKLEL